MLLWASNTANKSGNYLYFQNDGNLVVYQTSTPSGVIWASNIYTSSPSASLAFYVMQTDGNLIMGYPKSIQKSSGKILDYYYLGSTGNSENTASTHFGKIQ